MTTSTSLVNALEALWGIESRLRDVETLPECELYRPRDFIVIEPRIDRRQGSWALFLARKEGIDTITLISRAKKLLGAKRATIQGLKDACSVSYQYVAFDTVSMEKRGYGSVIQGKGFKLFYLGTNIPLKPGGLPYNIFHLRVSTSSPRTLCDNAYKTSQIPGFYGPQRFGIERPNTHIISLFAGEGSPGYLLKEYSYRYPLEKRDRPGSYESRILSQTLKKLNPFKAARVMKVVSQALQSYLFNRALSVALSEGTLEAYSEATVTASCRGVRARVPAARLPSPRLEASRSRWARLVAQILEEEGISWETLRYSRPVLRPLKYPLCVHSCRAFKNTAVLTLTLPKGAYATIALREMCRVNWRECSKNQS